MLRVNYSVDEIVVIYAASKYTDGIFELWKRYDTVLEFMFSRLVQWSSMDNSPVTFSFHLDCD